MITMVIAMVMKVAPITNISSMTDERALVKGAASLGWVLSSRTPDTLTVSPPLVSSEIMKGFSLTCRLYLIDNFGRDRASLRTTARARIQQQQEEDVGDSPHAFRKDQIVLQRSRYCHL